MLAMPYGKLEVFERSPILEREEDTREAAASGRRLTLTELFGETVPRFPYRSHWKTQALFKIKRLFIELLLFCCDD